MIGWGVRAGGCEDFLLRWQASWPGRGLENKGPRCGPEKGEKEMSLWDILLHQALLFPHVAVPRPGGLTSPVYLVIMPY